MNDVIQCPKCGEGIPVTEALARPFIEAERARFEQELRQKRSVLEGREQDLQRQSSQLATLQHELKTKEAEFDSTVEQRLADERATMLATEAERIETQFQTQLEVAKRDSEAQQAKMAELQSAELEYRKERAALDDEKRQMDLTIARQIDSERAKIRMEAAQETQKSQEIAFADKDRTLLELSEKLAESQKAEIEIRRQRQALEEEKKALDLELVRRVDEERGKVRLEALQEAQNLHQLALADKDRALSELSAKLSESQRIELEIRKQRQALEEEKRALDLELARRLDEERKQIREATQREEGERNRLKFAEKDKVIEDLRKQAEELRRTSEQGSQQLQGEVQERELEAILRAAFPKDQIEPVAAGHSGGDIVQKVVGLNGLLCGAILWESKRTKAWSDAWLTKNKEDQREAGAHVGVIVSVALPKDVTRFDRREDVWVSSFDCAVPLATALRQTLHSTAVMRLAGQDRAGKSERAYEYITGQDFKHRVSAVAEAYGSIRDALEKERAHMNRAWARRQKDLDQLAENTSGLYGDLESILCQSMPEIEGMEPRRTDTIPQRAEEHLAELSRVQGG